MVRGGGGRSTAGEGQGKGWGAPPGEGGRLVGGLYPLQARGRGRGGHGKGLQTHGPVGGRLAHCKQEAAVGGGGLLVRGMRRGWATVRSRGVQRSYAKPYVSLKACPYCRSAFGLSLSFLDSPTWDTSIPFDRLLTSGPAHL